MDKSIQVMTQAWIRRNARPLECARWEFLFENGSKERVIQNLTAFQNRDGGFGHGLEPDFTLPHSSAIATWAACQILMEIDVKGNDSVVTSMINYLIQSYDKELGLWRTVDPVLNDYPHASHWHYEEGVQKMWMFNPSVELAAYLVHWTAEGSEGAQLGWNIIEMAKKRLFNCTEMDFHEINNYQKLVHILKNALPDREEISKQVNKLAEQSIDTEPTFWGKRYKALPLTMIHSKKEYLYEKYKDLVNENLKFLKDSIQQDGVWDITWGWNQYEENFHIAKQQWKGIIAINNYKILQEFK